MVDAASVCVACSLATNAMLRRLVGVRREKKFAAPLNLLLAYSGSCGEKLGQNFVVSLDVVSPSTPDY